jgi:lipopolysaccharide biosynthesis glycosyltransferase
MIQPLPVDGLILKDLRRAGLYTRPTTTENGRLIDVLSRRSDYDGAMSTEFAISRFLVPEVVRRQSLKQRDDRLALFVDADVLALGNLDRLFGEAIDQGSKAVYVVKHNFNPPEGTKMDGQVQTRYFRKNWSSVMLFNVDHVANRRLTLELINTAPGRDLHAFCWLEDEDIGELDPKWNYLVGFHTLEQVPRPQLVHFTDGIPTMKGYEECQFATEWNAELLDWAR